MGPLRRERPISRAFFYTLLRAQGEKKSLLIKQNLTFFSESPVKELPYMFPQQRPCGETLHLQSQLFTYSSI
jgi:hypothetical protein